MKIYFLRHGESTSDLEARIESRYDAPLTLSGIEQAKSAADFFESKAIKFDRILASPLKRAFSTAQAIGERQGIPVEPCDALMEVNRGVLCGMLREDADKTYPRKAFKSMYEHYPEGSGESALEGRARAMVALQKTLSSGVQTLLIVSHGHLLNELVSSILSTPIFINDQHGAVFSFGNCGYMAFNYRPDSDKFVLFEMRLADTKV